jgi:hypothetical protein
MARAKAVLAVDRWGASQPAKKLRWHLRTRQSLLRITRT